MPAYNGAKYIGAQIESLLAQTFPNIDIYIRDDKSSDQTVDVIKSFMGKEPDGKKIILIDSDNTNWGYIRNVFDSWKLTNPADYYCFCDQDDYWHADKVEKSVSLLESMGEEKPALCFTGFNYCDMNLNFMRHSEPIPEKLNLKNVCYDFVALNFNITVNHAFRTQFFSNLPADGKYPYYPDLWMSQMAAAQGRLFFLNEALVEYRRNEQAVSYFNRNAFTLLAWRIRHFLINNETKTLRYELTSFQKAYSTIISEKDNRMLDIFNRKNGNHYFQRLFYPARLRRKLNDEIALRLMFLFGKL